MNLTIHSVPVTARQKEVYDVFMTVNRPLPDHVLVPLVQHLGKLHQSSSGIRSRRAELVEKRLVQPSLDTTKMPSGRFARNYVPVVGA
jgi:hypothetical protein